MDSTKTKKATAAHDQEQLPWELVEEILSHVPPVSLVRFRTVCKRWNALFNDKRFINNHKSTFRFIISTESKIYSVSIDPKIVVCELALDIPGIESEIIHLVDCDEFLLCCTDQGAAVWNPWLKQSRWIKADASQPNSRVDGIGYVNNNNNNNMRAEERRYKTIGSYGPDQSEESWLEIYDFVSDTWNDHEIEVEPSQGDKEVTSLTRSGVSLNGNLYWVAYYEKTDPLYHLLNFDFSKKKNPDLFCYLPCGRNHHLDALVLRVFKGDRFSLLRQCHVTKKIEIWVTKNKINIENGADVVWMNFMTLPISNFPSLHEEFPYSQPSYFIDDKRLVLCSCDETGHPWIYVVKENKLISKVQLNSVVDPWPLHCTYCPCLVPVPGVPREEVLLPV
ncbi:hypothetical protein Bca52824_025760 [Brassica carinata]|uniref:F-box domain-containing protein n=1 Tax=Brassica carinata TaxID=52824 RepID=A0A8X7SH94_BRACI|nr:hypothetical protein Bca52824_025760 [Brassica carinata]